VARSVFPYLAAAGVFWGVGHLGHRRADNERFSASMEEVYHFVPNAYAVRVAALGYHTMFADLTWVRAVLLFGEGIRGADSAQNELLEGMLRTVSVLDPHWRTPHFYGGGMLRVNGDIDGSDEIYARGMAGLPNDPYFPFSLAMNAYLYRKDVERAAHFLDLAARVPGAPTWYRAAAAGVLDKEGRTSTALQYLRDQIEAATDEQSRAPLVRKYQRVLHDYLSEELTQLVPIYEAHFGVPLERPEQLSTLPAELLPRPGLFREGGTLPPEPMGSVWILDPHRAVVGKARDLETSEEDRDSEIRLLRQAWTDVPGALPPTP
jgi:hypothetical protein